MLKFPEDTGKKAVWTEEVKGLVRAGDEVDWRSGEQVAFLRRFPLAAKLTAPVAEKQPEEEPESTTEVQKEGQELEDEGEEDTSSRGGAGGLKGQHSKPGRTTSRKRS